MIIHGAILPEKTHKLFIHQQSTINNRQSRSALYIKKGCGISGKSKIKEGQ
jgi:hypothetical protein